MELKCLCINNNYLNYMNGDHRSYIATFAVAKSKSEKKKTGLHVIRTLDLCDTGAAI